MTTTMNINDKARNADDAIDRAYRDSAAYWLDRGFEASAAESYGNVWVDFSHYFETPAEAVAFKARFPKGAKVTTSTLSGVGDTMLYSTKATYRFISNGVTGERNEAAIKRFRQFEKAVIKQGLEVNWAYHFGNSVSHDHVQAHIA